MSLKLDPRSRKAVFRIRNLKKLSKAGIEHGSFVSGKGLVRATNAAILEKPKGGVTYIIRTKSGRRRSHVASAPRETHANMTGTLRKTLSFKVSPTELEFGYGVDKNNAPDYADFVEGGTRKMANRPSLQIGIKNQRRNMVNNYEREIGKRLGDKI